MRSFVRAVRAGDYVVVFASTRAAGDDAAYAEMAEHMVRRAAEQRGYVGIDSTRGSDGFGITASYWESVAAIRDWKANVEHQEAQAKGRDQWYSGFHLCIARVERDHEMI